MKRFLIVTLTFSALLGLQASADVKSSKANGYAVIGIPDGVQSSKANGYAVVAIPEGVQTSKANAYAIIMPVTGISVSKAVLYAVIATPDAAAQPNVFIISKR